MGPIRLQDRTVRPRLEEEVDYDEEEVNLKADAQDSEDDSEAEDQSSSASTGENDTTSDDDASDTPPEDEPKEPADLKDISFGALAQAQSALGPGSRKRKLADTKQPEETSTKIPRTEDRRVPKEHVSRSSKHAPAIQSSRRAVTRRLEIFKPSQALKSRDPRFDPLIQSSSNADPNSAEKANKNYSFLTTYQADEILSLKSQIKNSKDPSSTASLKAQLMSLESKLRRAEALNREKEILRKHKREEREAIASGAKERPYYLKKSDVKREVLTQRFEGMSKKAREKAVERKRKRVKGKESLDMPRVRRER
jgi:ribosomal RNA-processing protein 36